MNTVLWAMQSLVALVFFSIGFLKTFGSKKRIQKIFSANTPVTVFTTRLQGFLEIMGAIAIIFPLLLNIYPSLTAIASACLGLVMIGAAIFHFRKKEYKALAFVIILFILTVIIAINRY
jgi:uncharacterized membrane protein YphA (DoxX/SURF4 family)